MTPENEMGDLSTGVVALESLCKGFYDSTTAIKDAHSIAPESLPDPFNTLLNHREHMTTKLTAHYQRPIELRVLSVRDSGQHYARQIELTVDQGQRIVEFGIARLNLALIAPHVREEVLSQQTPLGDVLRKHDVMRRIDPKWYFKFGPDSPFTTAFKNQTPVYGRVGIIHCNDQPAIQLLEVVCGNRNES
jgi:chorismate-pyruvate lyase